MSNHQQTGWRKQLLFYSILAMLTGLFLSRVLLSVSMTVFLLASFLHKNRDKQIKIFLSSPLLWSVTLLFLLPFISGLWSSDKGQWLSSMRVKLPLLFFPVAFASGFDFKKEDWERVAKFFLFAGVAGSIWSIIYYIGNMEVIHQGYLRSGVIITPLENDHVRFSWMIAIAILVAGWFFFEKRKSLTTARKTVFILVAAWLIIYLHLLAARTGLLCFYAMVLVVVTWLIVKQKKKWVSISILLAVPALPVTAYFLLPTFHNRVKYMQYDYGYFKEAHYKEGMNDAVRIISMRAGWSLMNTNIIGTGFGDVWNDARSWYDKHYTGMTAKDKILPSSEPLMYGAGCGWVGFAVFFLVGLMPFFLKKNLLWILVNTAVFPAFLTDITLEVQFGVFLYVFTLLFFYRWVNEILKMQVKN